MQLSDNTRLAYIAYMKCVLEFIALCKRVSDCRVLARFFVVNINKGAFFTFPVGHTQARLRRRALGVGLVPMARVVESTHFLTSGFILSGTIEGGTHRAWKRFTMLNEVSVVLDCCRLPKSGLISCITVRKLFISISRRVQVYCPKPHAQR